MVAKIYNPVKNAMQSGKRKAGEWLLEYEATNAKSVDPLMGWIGNSDTKQQIRLKFLSCDDAVNYAEKHHIDYILIQPQKAKLIKQTYAENFLSSTYF